MGRNESDIVGNTKAIREVRERISRFAPLPYPVLLIGETGCGKELAARGLHERSGRPGAFVPVNAACLPANLVESELFGHVRGAFTGAEGERRGLFEAAHRGTLFLDELETLTLPAQERLLRVVETGTLRRVGDEMLRRVDVRIVTATNVDPRELLRAGTLRPDLYFRLNVLELRIPPLRERLDDLPLLADHLLERIRRETGLRLAAADPFDETTVETLAAYEWPGNVRELETHLRRCAVMSSKGRILPPDPRMVPAPRGGESTTLEAYAKRIVRSREGRMPLHRIARELGVSRKTLWAWKKKWEASPPPLLVSAAS